MGICDCACELGSEDEFAEEGKAVEGMEREMVGLWGNCGILDWG